MKKFKTIVQHNSIVKIKKKALEDHIPIIMDEVLEKIYETIGDNRLSSILEIGTAYGYSSICFTQMLENGGKIDTIERDAESIKHAKKNIKCMKLEDTINVLEGDAVEILKTLNGTYDMVFIDAAKSKYPIFLEHALRLTHKGSYIIADNVLFKGYVLSDYNKHKQRTAVNHLREFLKMVQENPNLETELLDIGDGITISRVIK